MASSSTSSIPTTTNFMYDVFLSFRGEDTRKNFVDHLYNALVQGNIVTFKDDKNMEKGKRISTELIKAIEDSRFHIIVFSKNYASSSWCLDELVKIMECRETTEQKAYPIFYDVEPSEVRKQSGAFGEAFSKHRNEVDAGKWRKAMKEAADLSGWELKTMADGHEFLFIQAVVEEISRKLPFVNNVDENLVGMVTRTDAIVSSLETSVDDVRIIGIKGIGGGGKTTLATAVFDQISSRFEGKSFVENVRENSKPDFSGLKELQKQVLSDVLNNQGITVSGVHDGKNKMKKMLHGRKVLIVLDDVDHIGQLEALAGELSWFMPGSRIIITTRDEHVLIAHDVKLIHDVNLLSDEEAIHLFNRFAFKGEIPNPRYKELSQQVVHYASGLPLTIKVLGSDLKGKDEDEWKDTLESLKTIPLEETLQKLELSYIGLKRDHKDIFLDVACFWKDRLKDKAIRALECCKLHAICGLSVLERKSLISVSHGCLRMHDSIQDMGRDIVRREHRDEPHKHSRLWIKEEIENILLNDLGTEATRCISLRVDICQDINMKGLRKMTNLRFLSLHYYAQTNDDSDLDFLDFGNDLFGDIDIPDDINFSDGIFGDDLDGDIDIPDDIDFSDRIFGVDEVSQYIPDALQYLCWEFYPFRCLPNAFRAKHLVGLEMPCYLTGQLWESGEREVLKKLKYLVLDYSMLRTLDLGVTPNLETLSLILCSKFEELHIPHKHPKLKSLHLTHSKLKSFDLRQTPNLEILSLHGCPDLEEFHMPDECPTLKSLSLACSNLKILDLRRTLNLERLFLQLCDDFVKLHMPDGLPKLESLFLEYSKLRTLDLGQTLNPEPLSLEGCDDLVALRMPRGCPNLKYLNLIKCSNLNSLNLGMTPQLKSLKLNCSKLKTIDLNQAVNLERLSLKGCHDLLHISIECPKLKSLELEPSKLETLDLRQTASLEMLSLKGCHDLLHISIGCPKLKSLKLDSSKLETLNLRQTTSLEMLSLLGCHALVELSMPVKCLKLKTLDVICSKLRTLDLEGTLNLEKLTLDECRDLVEILMPPGCPKLESFILSDSKMRTVDLRQTTNLMKLNLQNCDDLVELSMPVKCPKLKTLDLSCSKLRSLNLGPSPNLEELILRKCDDLVKLCMPVACQKLKTLILTHSKLRILNLRRTPDLEILELGTCFDLVKLRMSRCLKLKQLKLRRLSKLRKFDLSLTPNVKDLTVVECCNLVELHAPAGCLEKMGRIDFPGCRRLNVFKSPGGDSVAELCLIVVPVEVCPLHPNNNLPKFRFRYYPSSVGKLKKLISVGLCACTNLKKISRSIRSICDLQHLRKLSLEGSIPEVPKDLGRLENLEELSFVDTEIIHLPDSICMLLHLKSLILERCLLLEKLPEDLGRLKCLEKLILVHCERLRDIPKSIGKMKCLRYLHLSYCMRVKKLPEEVGHLVRLKKLWIEGTRISHLPHTILLLYGVLIWGSHRLLLSSGFTCGRKYREDMIECRTEQGIHKNKFVTGSTSGDSKADL